MNSINKTLYIPLYGKALVSARGIILRDTRAEEIWKAEGFPLKRKSRSRWLAYYMGMRAAVFDRWTQVQMAAEPGAAVIHIGCGMDSRVDRVGNRGHLWFDVDFPDVIRERMRFYRESEEYRMIPSDIRSPEWLELLPESGSGIIVMEGVSMYLHPEELREVLGRLNARFQRTCILMDCYTEFAAKASRYKNPIKDVGVACVYGLDDPRMPEGGTGCAFVREHDMTPGDLVRQLHGMERWIFQRLFAGSFAKKMYRLYEYRKNS